MINRRATATVLSIIRQVIKEAENGRLPAQLHGSLTPAHACGCGAQCFVGVQRASIINLPRMSSPAGRHACFAASVDRSFPGEVMAHRPYGSIQGRTYPSALCCTGGLPSGFLCQGPSGFMPDRRDRERENLSQRF